MERISFDPDPRKERPTRRSRKADIAEKTCRPRHVFPGGNSSLLILMIQPKTEGQGQELRLDPCRQSIDTMLRRCVVVRTSSLLVVDVLARGSPFSADTGMIIVYP